MKHEDDAERAEQQADRLEEQSEAVGDRIDEARREWEQKESAEDVPGAQPEREHEAVEDEHKSEEEEEE